MNNKQNQFAANPGLSSRGFAFILPTILLFAIFLAGCGNHQPYVTESRLTRGLVIVLPGIEGRGVFNEAICNGLNEGGVNWAIQLYDWTVPLGPLINLKAFERNREKAHQIADLITRYRWSYPGRPVVLVGQSGGGAMATWAMEVLPPWQQVDGAILLAASLSPRYSLEGALMNCEKGIINFYSPMDWLMLGLGTTFSGTMDGQHTSSAGRLGFQNPEYLNTPDIYDKLFQVPWTINMARTGNVGTHLSSGAGEFVATYVAPLILAEQWNMQLISTVTGRPIPEPIKDIPQEKPAAEDVATKEVEKPVQEDETPHKEEMLEWKPSLQLPTQPNENPTRQPAQPAN